jgi:hypothetical protein
MESAVPVRGKKKRELDVAAAFLNRPAHITMSSTVLDCLFVGVQDEPNEIIACVGPFPSGCRENAEAPVKPNPS